MSKNLTRKNYVNLKTALSHFKVSYYEVLILWQDVFLGKRTPASLKTTKTLQKLTAWNGGQEIDKITLAGNEENISSNDLLVSQKRNNFS